MGEKVGVLRRINIISYILLLRPSIHGMAIMALLTMSTGIVSPFLDGSTHIARRTPFPVATATPTGPFILSTHPAIGSFRLAVTAIKNADHDH